MKGLRKYLTPFAPDQSGAVSMCYALGGMVVIVDAGGCAGNICGFDEPRWQPDYGPDGSGRTDPSGHAAQVGAVFSAALRDMDAILGRDDFLIKKVEDTSKQIDIQFIALVGTPVPAVIGTDLQALCRMAERKTHLPCIAVSSDGMHMYDRGIEDALLALVKKFSGKEEKKREGVCGVLGLNPLDLFDPGWTEAVKTSLEKQGYEKVLLHTMEGGLDTLKMAGAAQKNYVVSPAGIASARYLEKEFGTPYEITFPADPMILLEENPFGRADGAVDLCSLQDLGSSEHAAGLSSSEHMTVLPSPDHTSELSLSKHVSGLSSSEPYQVLIVHQQVLANAIRSSLRERGMKGSIVAATWFDLRKELAQEGDVKLSEEDDFEDLARQREWDLIIADPSLRPVAKNYRGKWIDAYHFAVSGQAAIRHNLEKRGSRE